MLGRLLVCAALVAAAPQEPPQEEPEILGKPSAFDLSGGADEERIALDAGARLRREPHPQAPVLTILDVSIELPVLERQGGWARVRHLSWTGWVEIDALAPMALEPLRVAGPDPERLALAEELLGEGLRRQPLGPFRLYTDVEDTRLVRRLRRLADELLPIYRERFGLDPGDDFDEILLLFRDEEDYRTFEAGDADLARLEAAGHAGMGLAGLFVGERSGDEVLALAAHELTHLFNRRALGREAAAWLEEGLCEDLALSKLDARGRPQPGTLSGAQRLRRGREFGGDGRAYDVTTVDFSGAVSSLRDYALRLEDGSATPLTALLDMPWSELVAQQDRQHHYTASALLVRYLLDGDDGALAAGFRGFLADSAGGGPADRAALLAALGLDPVALQDGFETWVGEQVDAAGILLAQPTDED